MEALLYLAIVIIVCVGMWKMFEKAGEPGWAALIPIYNVWVLTRIGGKPWWWMLLYLVPLLNAVMFFLLYMAIARRFGEPVIYAVGLFFLPFIFFPLLGFGRARYSATA
ncbi:DUF5684 domain-containing protein [Salidesulfovibrio onnuriiensis]|uniref:DUF5684 domain-containing protein n=1 Tax=Salidesulfovibrio onnuriiensis TaxID=2583823 RepID=UPI0011C7CB3A|nr:DUF5684 domain-containing protein [Salidesulfovibrio onnuriiensis]